jgi:hypothetical protein
MIPISGGVRVYVATGPVDFRRGHDGLAAVVQETLKLEPFCGAVFVSRSRRADHDSECAPGSQPWQAEHGFCNGCRGVTRFSRGEFLQS